MAVDPLYRRYHQDTLTFRMIYAFTENFVLPLSHDEVVHGKGSLLAKMPGDAWQRFANLRLLYAYQYAQPGKKLLFMGAEFAQDREWSHESSLDWHLEREPAHGGVARLIGDLNHLYRSEPALYQLDTDPGGFQWVDCSDLDQSIVSLVRRSREDRLVLVVCNLTPVPRTNYLIGVPRGGFWREALNSDSAIYGGSGHGNLGGLEAAPIPAHGRYHSLSLVLPPLAAMFFISEGA
jgi:1,4-alpha-glucan branching enzyme